MPQESQSRTMEDGDRVQVYDVSTALGAVPPHDRAAAEALAGLGEFPSPPVGMDLIEVLRLTPPPPQVSDDELGGKDFSIREYHVTSYDEEPIPVLVCRPDWTSAPTPALYWVHGGGMVTGSHRDGLGPMLELARANGAALISVGYRLAPEHPGLVPVEDCLAGLSWLQDEAAALQIDADGIVVVGASAGGGIAAGAVLLARDRARPVLAGLMLWQPMLDDRNDSPSAVHLARWATWTREINEAAWSALLGADRRERDVSPYASPARATDLAGFPPTFIDIGSTDLFRSEAALLAERLWLAGGIAELHVWPGGFHGYENLAPDSEISRGTLETRAAWLRRYLRPNRSAGA